MKIESKGETSYPNVRDVAPGDCFRWQEHTLLRLAAQGIHGGGAVQAADLSNGKVLTFYGPEKVERLQAKVITWQGEVEP